MSQQQQADAGPSSAAATTTTTTTTTPPLAPPPPTTTPEPRRRHLPQILTARILVMILQNGIALALHLPRPNGLAAVNALRTHLLTHTPFFDPSHQPEELRSRIRRSPISFVELVVLMARLMRVLMKLRRGEDEAEEVRRERVEVRNECLDLPFFDRGSVGSGRLFSGGEQAELEDEGCVV